MLSFGLNRKLKEYYMGYTYSDVEKFVIESVTAKVHNLSPKHAKDKIQPDAALSLYGLDSLDIAELFMIDFDRKFKTTIDEEDMDSAHVGYLNITINNIIDILCEKLSIQKIAKPVVKEPKKISALRRFLQTKFKIKNKNTQNENQY